ncbi:MAG: gas vesicle protein GvpO [Nanoarchaeota archaeon]
MGILEGKMNLLEIQRKVLPEIKELLKKEPEGISSIEKNENGWTIHCEVLEKKAIPETYDLLKVYEFILDNNAKINSFKVLRKIRRGDVN